MLCAVFVKEHINSVQRTFIEGSVHPVDNTITFSSIDVNWVLQPLKNSLILTLKVTELDMRRILVDPSSSADLLQMSAYRQMGYSPFALENLRRLLFKFNEATITSLGDVVLVVQADLVTLSVWFSMVDDLSPYNDIIGRA